MLFLDPKKGNPTMNEKFSNIVKSAAIQKQDFSHSVENLKDELDSLILNKKMDYDVMSSKELHKLILDSTSRTGWLRGSFSYPWMFFCIAIPAVIEMLK